VDGAEKVLRKGAPGAVRGRRKTSKEKKGGGRIWAAYIPGARQERGDAARSSMEVKTEKKRKGGKRTIFQALFQRLDYTKPTLC